MGGQIRLIVNKLDNIFVRTLRLDAKMMPGELFRWILVLVN